MSKSIITLFLTLLTFLVVAQDPFDEYIRRRPNVSCEDVNYNAYEIIKRLHAKRETDSLYTFLNYWERHCGPVDPIESFRLVLDISTRKFDASRIDSTLFVTLMRHGDANLDLFDIRPWHHPYRYYYHYPSPSLDSLRIIIQEIAGRAYSNNPDEQLILNFYASEDPSFEEIRNASEESILRRLWEEMNKETRKLGQGHFALATGVVRYTGNASIFGTRPNLGFILGGKKMRHNFDFILAFRMGPSRREYTFQYEDNEITHRDWTGMYVGTEYTYDFISTRWIDMGLSGGIAYDRITAITADNDFGEDPDFLNSFNKNAGLVIKYRVKEDGLYFGLHLRYNWVDYNNPNGTPLDGEYLNIRFVVGTISNFDRQRTLRTLNR